jgi:hypothetical protein
VVNSDPARAERWPVRWQTDAIAAVDPYIDSEYLVEILVGDPATSIDGTLVAGYVYTDPDGELRIIHDRSGRPDVFPWRPPIGPVLRVSARLPGGRRTVIYAHPEWTQRSR